MIAFTVFSLIVAANVISIIPFAVILIYLDNKNKNNYQPIYLPPFEKIVGQGF